eukprot:2004134-Prymnesium_polylepis.1
MGHRPSCVPVVSISFRKKKSPLPTGGLCVGSASRTPTLIVVSRRASGPQRGRSDHLRARFCSVRAACRAA